MANSPLNENQSENLGSTEPFLNSYAAGADSRTVEDMSASPNFIKALERKRLIEELDGKRPRFATDEKTAKNEPSELIGVLNGAIAQRSFPKQKIEADQIALAKVHAGRVSLIDASKSFNWSKDTNLSFTVSVRDGITITEGIQGEKKTGKLDRQSRCVLPATARRLLDLKNGESVLVLTISAPIEHVRIIPISLVLEALAESESK